MKNISSYVLLTKYDQDENIGDLYIPDEEKKAGELLVGIVAKDFEIEDHITLKKGQKVAYINEDVYTFEEYDLVDMYNIILILED